MRILLQTGRPSYHIAKQLLSGLGNHVDEADTTARGAKVNCACVKARCITARGLIDAFGLVQGPERAVTREPSL